MITNMAAIQVNIMCIVVLVLILATLHHGNQAKMQTKAFKMVLGWFIVFSALDIVAHCIPPSATDAALILIFGKIFTCSFVGFCWFLYIYFVTEYNSYKLRKWAPLVITPIVAIIVYALVNTITQFGTGEVLMNNGLWISFNVISVGYIVTASCIALKRARKCRNKFVRRTYNYLAFIMFIPVTALGIQSMFLDIVISAPVMVFVMLFLYIKSLQGLITTDPISGLNNKYQLAKHLDSITQKNGSNKRVFLIQLEINNYCDIVKEFSKSTGEQLVENVGDFFREISRGQDIFLSRIEKGIFALVAEKKEFAEVEVLCKDIVSSCKTSKIQGLVPWKISFSIYWSEYGTESVKSIDDMFVDLKNHCICPPAAPIDKQRESGPRRPPLRDSHEARVGKHQLE